MKNNNNTQEQQKSLEHITPRFDVTHVMDIPMWELQDRLRAVLIDADDNPLWTRKVYKLAGVWAVPGSTGSARLSRGLEAVMAEPNVHWKRRGRNSMYLVPASRRTMDFAELKPLVFEQLQELANKHSPDFCLPELLDDMNVAFTRDTYVRLTGAITDTGQWKSKQPHHHAHTRGLWVRAGG